MIREVYMGFRSASLLPGDEVALATMHPTPFLALRVIAEPSAPGLEFKRLQLGVCHIALAQRRAEFSFDVIEPTKVRANQLLHLIVHNPTTHPITLAALLLAAVESNE